MRSVFSFFLFTMLMPTMAGASDLLTADSCDVATRNLQAVSAAITMPGQRWENPAMRHYLQDFSMSAVNAPVYSGDRGLASLSETGNKSRGFGIGAGSFMVFDEKSRMTGYASYGNSRRENTVWNENTDYELLYPYITGDSIGGDFHSEQYRFMGSYSRVIGKWVAGAELAYRAQLEYRLTDPRPKNVVSDAQLQLAAGRSMGRRYMISAKLLLNKYDQRSDIKFLSDLGSTSVYHMTGLGMDYVRFAGNKTTSKYEGGSVGAGIDILAKDHNGWGLSADYRAWCIKKLLSDLNNLPLNQLDMARLRVEVSYMKSQGTLRTGFHAGFSHLSRNGTDNIFSDATAGSYELLASQQQYSNPVTEAYLAYTIGNKPESATFHWLVKPSFGYKDYRETHRESTREMNITSAYGKLQTLMSYRITGKNMLMLNASYKYSTALDSDLFLPGMKSGESRYESLKGNYNYLSDTANEMNVSLGWNYQLSHKRLLGLTLDLSKSRYETCGNAQNYTITLDFKF